MPIQQIAKTLPNVIYQHFEQRKADDPIYDQAYEVQTLTRKDKQRLNKLEEFEDVSLNESTIGTKKLYEVIFKYRKGLLCTFGTVRLSYFRSKDKAEAKEIFNITKYNVNKVMKCFGNKGQKQEAALLKDVVALTVKNQTWRPSHIAAQMNAYQLFSSKNSVILKDMNKEKATKTCLHIALATQNLPTVKSILALKPELSTPDENGNTAVHFAAMTTLEIFKAVTSSPGAKELLKKKNKQGCTPLHLACYSNKPEIVIEFLSMRLSVADLTISPPKADNVAEETEDINSIEQTVPIFTLQMIEDIEMTDIIFGGSPLHWTTTRRSIEELLKMGFNVNSRNMVEETPLHVHTKRRRLKCVIALLCHEKIKIEMRSLDGDTPLHEAVKQLDIPVAQTLMVFDANLNAKNNNSETPRHLAAKGHTNAHDIILYALSFLGAERCDSSMKNCTLGCSHSGEFNGKAYAKWSNFEEEPLYKRILLEQTVQKALKEKKMMDMLRKENKQSTSKRNNIEKKDRKVAMLCFDGGGVRGLIASQILIELEKFFVDPIIDHFQWVVGTSTGALMSSLLSTRNSPKDIRKIYFTFKNKIMHGQKPYSSEAFESALKSNVDENMKMSDIKDNKLVLTVTLADRHPAQLHLFRSYESPIAEMLGTGEKHFTKSLPNCHEMKLWAACRASGSAPVYFNPYGPYIDGGVIANNPTLDALAEFTLHNESLRFTQRDDEVEELKIVVSIGTGKIPVTLKDPLRNVGKIIALNPADAYRNAIMAKDLLVMILDQATGTDAHVVHRAQAWCHGIGVPYFRLNPPLSEALPLDTTEDEELINVMWETKAYMYAVRPQLVTLVELLAKPGEKIKRPDMKLPEPVANNDKPKTPTVAGTRYTKRELIRDFEYDFKLQDTLMSK